MSSSSLAPAPPQPAQRSWAGKLFDRVWGNHHVQGRLVHPQGGDPLTNAKVYVYAKVLSVSHLVGEATSDKDGNYALDYKWFNSASSNESLAFSIFEQRVVCNQQGGLNLGPEKFICEFTRSINPHTSHHDVGVLPIHYYEYRDDFPNLKDPQANENEWPYDGALLKAAADEEIKDAAIKLWPFDLSIEKIKEIYGVNDPSFKLSGESTIDMLENGICPCYWKKGATPEEVYVEFKWGDYDQDEHPQVFDVRLDATIDSSGQKHVKSVTVHSKDNTPMTSTPSEENFEKLLFVFNSMASLAGELFFHLGRSHIFCGQIAISSGRSLHINPIKALLQRHLAFLEGINWKGIEEIFGQFGILNVSGLTVKGIEQALYGLLGTMCWGTFEPRKIWHETHRFARAANIFWEVAGKAVKKFIEEHGPNIEKHWYEIFDMSKNQTDHSPPFHPLDGVADRNEWFDSSEIDDPSLGIRVDGKAMRPITLNRDHPEPGDWDRLFQFCRYVLFMVVFWHWWIHTSQKKWVANPDVGTLAPDNNGEGPYGGASAENVRKQVKVAKELTDFLPPEAVLINNFYTDIYPYFIECILEKKVDLEAAGVDVEALTDGISI
jgi:hypothetical protein